MTDKGRIIPPQGGSGTVKPKRLSVTNEARQELDAAVHAHVFGRDPAKELVPMYSSTIAEAWRVHQAVCNLGFNQRKLYYYSLQKQATVLAEIDPAVQLVAWPEVLGVLKDHMPEAICRAALSVVNAPKEPLQSKGARTGRGGLLGRG
jgi:hypothetical protein